VIDDSVSLIRAIFQVVVDDHLDGQMRRVQMQIHSLAATLASLIPRTRKVRLRFNEPTIRDGGPVKTISCYLEAVLELP
jgi:cob(I)alamin adenosyltransferase